MRILSIDFDYFISTDIRGLSRYLDSSCEFPRTINEAIWIARYGDINNGNKTIEESIKFDFRNFEKLKIYLKNKKFKYFGVSNSHAYIYNFIKSNISSEDENIEIWNIDFHNDESNNDTRLNCGNWLKLLKNNRFFNITSYWINKELSYMNGNSSYLKQIKDLPENFDLIFLCKSESWVPPHFDTHFNNLFHIITSLSENSIIFGDELEDLLSNRYNQKFKDKVKEFKNNIKI